MTWINRMDIADLRQSPAPAGHDGNTRAALDGIPLFSGMGSGQLDQIAAIAVMKRYDRGDVIFMENDPGLGFHAIVHGRIKIYKTSASGKEQILHVLGPGETFGEVAVFMGRNFPAHAMALDDASTVFLPRGGMTALFRREPELAMSMLAILSGRLREFVRKIEELSLKEVPARLAAHLLLLAEGGRRDTVVLDIPKSLLASLLGTIPETLSRILARMGDRGLVAVDGSTIRLLDVKGLEVLAEGLERL